MKRSIDVLKEHSTGEPGAWKRQAQEELEAWDWKQYSYMIAIKARRQMGRLQMTQKQLAEAMGCTQQYVSLLLSGNLNMTLETIARLEKALQFTLLGELMDLEPQYPRLHPTSQYLSEGPAPGYGGDEPR
jgi:ribosome-binding protein aMBF1 (putative translation factor)